MLTIKTQLPVLIACWRLLLYVMLFGFLMTGCARDSQDNKEAVSLGDEFVEGNVDDSDVNDSAANEFVSDETYDSSTTGNLISDNFVDESLSSDSLTANEAASSEAPGNQTPHQEASNDPSLSKNNGQQNADLLPSRGTIWWVAYDYNRYERYVKVKILTKGRPRYRIYQQTNAHNQLELIIRFYATNIRRKIRRDIDASEFLSPISYIRMYYDDQMDAADVILTMRENVKGRIFSKRGNVLLTFDLPQHYLWPHQKKAPVREFKAEPLSQDLALEFEQGSDLPVDDSTVARVYQPDPAAKVFGEVEDETGEVLQPDVMTEPVQYDEKGLPVNQQDGNSQQQPNHQSPVAQPDHAWIPVATFGFMQVGQANLEQDLQQNTASSDQDLLGITTNTDGDVVGQDSEAENKEYTGKPVKLEFYEAPMSEVLKAFSEQTGTNFIYPPGIGSTNVTIKLKNVPWDAALDAILETYQLGMTRVSDNVIRVDKISEMNTYLQQREQANMVKKLAERRKILVVRVSNAKASDLVNSLKEFFKIQGLDNRTNISVDERTNSLFIEAPPFILAKAKSLIARLDVPIPQVEIMGRLIEVRRTLSNFLGISWNGGYNFDANSGLGFGSSNFPNHFNSAFAIDPGVNSRSGVGDLSFNLGSINDFIDLTLRLRMEESRGTTEILQTSRVVVKDGEPASIQAGSQLYFPTFSSIESVNAANQGGQNSQQTTGSVSIANINFSLSLRVTPKVSNDGLIDMNIDLTSQTPQPSSLVGSAVQSSSRNLKTQMVKASGQTAVIGGIYDTKKIKQVVGIPVISKLPIIGALFRSQGYSEDQTELMMLITPTILGREGQKITADNSAPILEEESGEEPQNIYEPQNNMSNASNNYSNSNVQENQFEPDNANTYNSNQETTNESEFVNEQGLQANLQGVSNNNAVNNAQDNESSYNTYNGTNQQFNNANYNEESQDSGVE